MSHIHSIDYYKFTMSQFIHRFWSDQVVTFSINNRGGEPLHEIVPILKRRFEGSDAHEHLSKKDIEFLRSQGIFDDEYLDYLFFAFLPGLENAIMSDGRVEITGQWRLVTFWETIMLAAINEEWNHHKKPVINLSIGRKNLLDKIEILKRNPDIKIADFGTRRRYSEMWHSFVIDELLYHCPDNLVGTSNVGLAKDYNIPLVGTYAHELPMVYAAAQDQLFSWGASLAPDRFMRLSQKQLLDNWRLMYSNKLSIALSDTYGSSWFLNECFTEEDAHRWDGLRQDSGDPFAFGEMVIKMYKHYGIDPSEKTIVFSDALTLQKIIDLFEHFKGQIKMVFGWGTNLTNDVGLKPLNIVMKATAVSGHPTVKLSDGEGKYTGSSPLIRRYKKVFKEPVFHG